MCVIVLGFARCDVYLPYFKLNDFFRFAMRARVVENFKFICINWTLCFSTPPDKGLNTLTGNCKATKLVIY